MGDPHPAAASAARFALPSSTSATATRPATATTVTAAAAANQSKRKRNHTPELPLQNATWFAHPANVNAATSAAAPSTTTAVPLAYSPMPSYDSFAMLSSSQVSSLGLDEMLNNFQLNSPISASFPASVEHPAAAAGPSAAAANLASAYRNDSEWAAAAAAAGSARPLSMHAHATTLDHRRMSMSARAVPPPTPTTSAPGADVVMHDPSSSSSRALAHATTFADPARDAQMAAATLLALDMHARQTAMHHTAATAAAARRGPLSGADAFLGNHGDDDTDMREVTPIDATTAAVGGVRVPPPLMPGRHRANSIAVMEGTRNGNVVDHHEFLHPDAWARRREWDPVYSPNPWPRKRQQSRVGGLAQPPMVPPPTAAEFQARVAAIAVAASAQQQQGQHQLQQQQQQTGAPAQHAKREPKLSTTTTTTRALLASALPDVLAHHHHAGTSSARHYHDVDPYGAMSTSASTAHASATRGYLNTLPFLGASIGPSPMPSPMVFHSRSTTATSSASAAFMGMHTPPSHSATPILSGGSDAHASAAAVAAAAGHAGATRATSSIHSSSPAAHYETMFALPIDMSTSLPSLLGFDTRNDELLSFSYGFGGSATEYALAPPATAAAPAPATSIQEDEGQAVVVKTTAVPSTEGLITAAMPSREASLESIMASQEHQVQPQQQQQEQQDEQQELQHHHQEQQQQYQPTEADHACMSVTPLPMSVSVSPQSLSLHQPMAGPFGGAPLADVSGGVMVDVSDLVNAAGLNAIQGLGVVSFTPHDRHGSVTVSPGAVVTTADTALLYPTFAMAPPTIHAGAHSLPSTPTSAAFAGVPFYDGTVPPEVMAHHHRHALQHHHTPMMLTALPHDMAMHAVAPAATSYPVSTTGSPLPMYPLTYPPAGLAAAALMASPDAHGQAHAHAQVHPHGSVAPALMASVASMTAAATAAAAAAAATTPLTATQIDTLLQHYLQTCFLQGKPTCHPLGCWHMHVRECAAKGDALPPGAAQDAERWHARWGECHVYIYTPKVAQKS
ncbi:hypothetical protein GGF31_004243 [Allomyces arbusculus]|nr:hypothetical protein GGF31_004243 [Allomyces arbusculus]